MTRIALAAPFAVWAVVMHGGLLAAQPDLSGSWEPIPGASVLNLVETTVPRDVPPPPPPPRTISLTITQAGNVVTMERRLARGSQASSDVDIRELTYEIDGAPTVSQNGPVALRTRATLDGNALVLTTEAAIDGRPFGTTRDRYTLVDGQLVVESTRTLPAGTITSRDVHRRISR